MASSVTVITMTRGSLLELRRAMDSVRSQTLNGRIEHLVLWDRCHVPAAVTDFETDSYSLRNIHVPSPDPDSLVNAPRWQVYEHLASLMNTGVALARNAWVAFLDDDNAYEREHLSSLLEAARSYSTDVVHSSRSIWNADGSPYLLESFPWVDDATASAAVYRNLVSRGIWVEGSNILHDQAGRPLAEFTNSLRSDPLGAVSMVDTSAWLLRRDRAQIAPVSVWLHPSERADGTAPDDKLLERLLADRARIVGTGLPTVRYYLGGMSNPNGSPRSRTGGERNYEQR